MTDKIVTVSARGLSPIGEMPRASIIREILSYAEDQFTSEPISELKKYLINMRLAEYRNRLVREAKLEPPDFLGFLNSLGTSDE